MWLMVNYFEVNDTIIKALQALEKNSLHQTLFVVDKQDVCCGTLTDGDIRRYLIGGGQLTDNVEHAVHRNFICVQQGDPTLLAKLKEFRTKKMKVVPLLDKLGHIVDVYDLINYKSHLPIDAVLMAGGKGELLRPLTEKIPKPLLKVGDKSIIDYNVERLISYGIENINVTVNYLREQLEEHFAKPMQGIRVQTIREPRFLGTMGSVLFVEQFYNDTVLVMNSDLFTNIDYEDFFFHFKEHDADMSIAAVPYTISVPYGIFKLNGCEVKGVLEKPTYNYYANAGIYLVKRELLNLIPKNTFFNATDFMTLLMERGYRVIRFPLNGTWIDIGNPQEYQKAKELVKHMK